MVGLKLVLIFIAILFADLLVLPAFFGFRNSFLSLLVLIIPIMYMRATGKLLVFGFAFAFVSESLRGLGFGEIALPFLFAAVAVFLIQRMLDMKHTYDTRFSRTKSVLIALVSMAFVYILNIDYLGSMISLTIVLEALVLVFVFNIVFNKKSDYM